MNTVDKSPPSLIGPDGKRFVVDAGSPIRLGRSADNDIVISDKSVSRYHAAISIENGRCTIRDLGSQNGTFVSGRRISSAEILDGQQVRFGDLELTLNNPVGHQDGPQPSEPAADTQPASVGWWRFRSVQAGALAAALALLGFAIVSLNHHSHELDQENGAHEQQTIGFASFTAGRSNFELPNASHDFVGDWAGTIRRTMRTPVDVISDSDLDEGIGFYEANGQIVMSVASYVHPGVTVASMKARALGPSHVLLEEDYVQKDGSGQTTLSHETVEYSPSPATKLDCRVTFSYYRDPQADPFAKLVYEGALDRVTAQQASRQTEALKAKGFKKDRELQTRLPKD